MFQKKRFSVIYALEQWLSEWKMTIDKRSGTGVMLIADNVADLLQLDQLLGNEGGQRCHDRILRRVKIASQLLSETPRETSINKLSERYFISSASIVNDLKIIESWIAPLGLALIRSQSGTHIEGSENSVRQAMASLINGVINHNEPGCIIHSDWTQEAIKRWCIILVRMTFYLFSHYYRKWSASCAGH